MCKGNAGNREQSQVPKAVQVQLKKILQPAIVAMLDLMAHQFAAVVVQDLDGEILFGEPSKFSGEKFPIGYYDRVVGWTIGDSHAELIADWLSTLWKLELEKKVIANEALQRYGELNCLYEIAEGLVSCQSLQDIAQLTIKAAKGILSLSDAAIVIVRDREQNKLEQIAGVGTAENYIPNHKDDPRAVIAFAVIEKGYGEAINDITADPRFTFGTSIFSAICVPLLGKQGITGVIVISSDVPIHYNASDLKLLKTIASQVAPAIDNFITYEYKLRMVHEREQKLQQQLLELRLELEIDEVKRVQQVAEITETDQFKLLLQKAEEHRQRRKRHRELS